MVAKLETLKRQVQSDTSDVSAWIQLITALMRSKSKAPAAALAEACVEALELLPAKELFKQLDGLEQACFELGRGECRNNEALAKARTANHAEGVNSLLDQWSSGETEDFYFSDDTPKLDAHDQEVLAKLREQTVFEQALYISSKATDLKAMKTIVGIGSWRLQAEWQYSYYREIYHELGLQFAVSPKAKWQQANSSEPLLKASKIEWPWEKLRFYLYLILYDCNDRPYLDDFDNLFRD